MHSRASTNNDKGQGGLFFCTGGNRSGKSAFALRLLERREGKKIFVGTAEALDRDMAMRIQRHREERGSAWQALDLPMRRALELPDFLREQELDGACLCLDCLGTWTAAAMEQLARTGTMGSEPEPGWEEHICRVFEQSVELLRSRVNYAVLVSIETGLGIVPADRWSRTFRDIVGRVNQLAAARSDECYLLISSLPLRLK